MIRHVVAMQWKEGTTGAQVDAVKDRLAKLPSEIDTVRAYSYGTDAGLGGNFHFVVVADFDDAAGYQVYADHPAHRTLVNEVILPIRAERAAVQYEV